MSNLHRIFPALATDRPLSPVEAEGKPLSMAERAYQAPLPHFGVTVVLRDGTRQLKKIYAENSAVALTAAIGQVEKEGGRLAYASVKNISGDFE